MHVGRLSVMVVTLGREDVLRGCHWPGVLEDLMQVVNTYRNPRASCIMLGLFPSAADDH